MMLITKKNTYPPKRQKKNAKILTVIDVLSVANSIFLLFSDLKVYVLQ